MATTTTIYGKSAYYGYSNYTNSAGTHMYVGDGYRTRIQFPALSGVAGIGQNAIAISQMILQVRRNSEGPATVTAGSSRSSAWGAGRDGTGKASIAASTGWKNIDISACANAVRDYTGNWYIHLTGGSDRVRFNGTSSDYVPRIKFTWEYVANTIHTDADSVTLGNPVTFSIVPESGDATFTLTYALGSASGTIAEKTSNTSIAWTPPTAAFAPEITDADEGMIEINMTVYDAAGSVVRTEVLYLTAEVPESVVPSIPANGVGMAVNHGLAGYGLTNKTTLTLTPRFDVTGALGATVKSATMTVQNGSSQQAFTWTNFEEDSPGILTGAPVTTAILTNAGTATITLEGLDTRGRTVSASRTLTVCAYADPVIANFAVDRYEPVYGEDEQITGYAASDVGDHVWVNLQASVSNVAPAGAALNSLHYTLEVAQGEVSALNSSRASHGGGATSGTLESGGFAFAAGTSALAEVSGALSSVTGGGGTSINLINDRTILTGAADIANTYTYTLTVYDDAGYSAVQYDTVAPGRANFSLAASRYGAAFGGIAKGTQSNPLLESYYLAKFYAGIDVDPNWAYLTVNSGVTTPGSYGNGRLRVGRIGRHVYVVGSVNAGGTNTVLCTLPESIPMPPEGTGVFTFAVCSGARIARIVLDIETRELKLEWVRNLSDGAAYTGTLWMDIRLDFWSE